MLLFASERWARRMMASIETAATAGKPASEVFENVACPFCGIHCDDLVVSRSGNALKVRNTSCGKAIAGFERPLPAASPLVDGAPVALAAVIEAAAALIKRARLPLFGGLATDVEGMRAAMSIADRSGGVVDHALSEGQYRNFRVLQTSGWFMSTLTEVRNRADLLVVVGCDLQKLHPRFFERVVTAPESMFSAPPAKRTVVFVGQGLDTSGATGPRIGEVVTLGCPPDKVGEVLAAVRALVNGRPIGAERVAGVPAAAIQALADRCRRASYGVMIWAPPGLAFPNADLTVHTVSELVKDLNLTTRFACLSLGGNEGAVTAGAVCGWQSGYPLRVSFATGRPVYDQHLYAIARMLAANEGDVLVWIASISPDIVPPATKIPTVVLGTPGLKLAAPPAVFIPVGTPGLDHAGRIVRCDTVVSLPLRNLKRAPLPSVADVLAAVEAAL